MSGAILVRAMFQRSMEAERAPPPSSVPRGNPGVGPGIGQGGPQTLAERLKGPGKMRFLPPGGKRIPLAPAPPERELPPPPDVPAPFPRPTYEQVQQIMDSLKKSGSSGSK